MWNLLISVYCLRLFDQLHPDKLLRDNVALWRVYMSLYSVFKSISSLDSTESISFTISSLHCKIGSSLLPFSCKRDDKDCLFFNYTIAFSTNPAMTQRDRGTTDEKGVPICVGQLIWRRNGLGNGRNG